MFIKALPKMGHKMTLQYRDEIFILRQLVSSLAPSSPLCNTTILQRTKSHELVKQVGTNKAGTRPETIK